MEAETIKNEIGGWELKPVSKLPFRMGERSYARPIIEQFRDSGHRCCLVVKDSSRATSLASTLRKYIRDDTTNNDAKNVGQVRAYRVRDEVYLINYDVPEQTKGADEKVVRKKLVRGR